MSVLWCNTCDKHIDTDIDVEGEEVDGEYMCFACILKLMHGGLE